MPASRATLVLDHDAALCDHREAGPARPLDRRLVDRRLWPAIDITRSGSRKEELLMDDHEAKLVTALRRALARLGAEYRDPLLLQVIGGFSCREIGAMLELKTNTVLTRLFRARKLMREQLEGDAVLEAAT